MGNMPKVTRAACGVLCAAKKWLRGLGQSAFENQRRLGHKRLGVQKGLVPCHQSIT